MVAGVYGAEAETQLVKPLGMASFWATRTVGSNPTFSASVRRVSSTGVSFSNHRSAAIFKQIKTLQDAGSIRSRS